MNGKLTISKPHNSRNGDKHIRLSLHDDLSGTVVAEVRVSLEDMMEAITGLGHVPCTFEMLSDVVGKRCQATTTLVAFKPCYGNEEERLKAAREAIAPHEVDGWIGSPMDVLNHHNQAADGRYRVTFVRYVDDAQPKRG